MHTYPLVLRDSDEIEQFFLEATGMLPGYLQLSRGLADLRLRVVELPRVTLIWTRARGKARWRDQMTGNNLHIGFAVESAGPINVRGHDVGADEGQLWMPDKEMDLILSGPNLTLEIGIEESLVDELGWDFAGDPLSKVPGRELKRLISTCSRVTDAVRGISTANSTVANANLESMRDLVLDELETVLQPWLQAAERETDPQFQELPHYRLVRMSDAFFESRNNDLPFDMDELVTSLGVPRRTLFHAFRKLLGVGPRRYLEIRRLHSLRSQLRRSSYAETTVTHLASDLGFGDMGRLAKVYQLHFGEKPSETLRYG